MLRIKPSRHEESMKTVTKLNFALTFTFIITAGAATWYNAKLIEGNALKQITAQAELLLAHDLTSLLVAYMTPKFLAK